MARSDRSAHALRHPAAADRTRRLTTRSRPLAHAVAALVAGAAMLALLSCGLLNPDFPDGARRYQPSIRYKGWWQAVEACSGRTGLLGAIRWYTAGDETIPYTIDGVNGIAYRGDVPVIVIAARHVNDGAVVRHEMLHVLLDRDGHPGEYFVQRCGGVVECEDACLREAGYPTAPPSPDTTVAVRELETTVHAYPDTVSLTADSGWVTVVVEARNPLPRAVTVALPPPPRLQRLFWYDLQAIRVDSSAFFGASVPFAASRTYRLAFDVRVGAQTSTGLRELRGGYSISRPAFDTLTIVR